MDLQRTLRAALVPALTAGALVATTPAAPAQAVVGKQALVLASSVSGGASSAEATRAAELGFAVTVVPDATWATLTATDFARYSLVVVGDPTCGSVSSVVSARAKPLADAVMARAGGNTKVGNRVLIGTDPRFHFDTGDLGGSPDTGGKHLIRTGVAFAGAQTGATGLYLTTSCSDPDYNGNDKGDVEELLQPLLTIDPTPGWSRNDSPPCSGEASLIANADQFTTLRSVDLESWFCSAHMTYPTFPTDWAPLAVSPDSPTDPVCGTDVDDGSAQCGESHILIAGSGIVAEAPNLSLTPATATNPVNTNHTVTATVTNPNATPRAGVTVNVVVTGANAGAVGTCVPASCATGADGKVAFTYKGTNPGDDTINASITVDGSTQTATATKKWTAVNKPTVCKVTAVRPGPPAQQDVTVTDPDGIALINGVKVINGTVSVPAFAPGTVGPVVLKATKSDPTKRTFWEFDVTDSKGVKTHCV